MPECEINKRIVVRWLTKYNYNDLSLQIYIIIIYNYVIYIYKYNIIYYILWIVYYIDLYNSLSGNIDSIR